jgi:hypothetical protein
MSWVAGSRAASLLAAPSRATTPLTLLAASAAEILVIQAHVTNRQSRLVRLYAESPLLCSL